MLSLFLLLSAGATHAAPAKAADAAKAFRDHEIEHFYLYSQTDKPGFSCRIRLKNVDQLVEGLRAKADAGKLPMDIQDSLSTFALQYTRATDTLEFTRPTLALKLKAEAKVEHPELLHQGMSQVFSGFNQQVEGAIGITQGMLHEFLVSRHDAISDVHFSASDNTYTARFSMAGGSTSSRFDGATKHSKINIGSGTTTAKAHFKPGPDDKLVLHSAEIVPSPGNTMTIKLDTQTIGGIIIPSQIQMDAVQVIGGAISQSAIRIDFTHCSVQ
jgi:hypothetical protein